MNTLVELLSEQGLLLIAGVTVFLLAGLACVVVTRSPVHRQRLAELTVVASLLWAALACVPLPRLLPELFRSGQQVQVVSSIALITPQVEKSYGATAMLIDPMLIGKSSSDRFSPVEESELQKELDALLTKESSESPTAPEPISTVLQPQSAVVGRALLSDTTGATPQSDPATDQAMPLGSWLATAYLACAAIAAAWLAAGYTLLLRVRQTAEQPPAWAIELFRSLVYPHDKHLPRLIVSRRCARAVSWGALRPVILLPASLCNRRDPQHL